MKNIKIILTIIYCVIANTTFAQFEPYKFSEKEKEECYLCAFLDGCIPNLTHIYCENSYILYNPNEFDLEIVKYARHIVQDDNLKIIATKLCLGEYDNKFIHIKTEYNLNYDDETGITDTVLVNEYYESIVDKDFIMRKSYYVERDEYGKLKPRTYDDCDKNCCHREYYLKDPNNIFLEFDSWVAEFAIKDIWGE